MESILRDFATGYLVSLAAVRKLCVHFLYLVENDSIPALFFGGGGLGDKENGGALRACGQMNLGEVWPFGH